MWMRVIRLHSPRADAQDAHVSGVSVSKLSYLMPVTNRCVRSFNVVSVNYSEVPLCDGSSLFVCSCRFGFGFNRNLPAAPFKQYM